VLCCLSVRRQHQMPTSSVRVGGVSITPVSAVRDLGVHLESDVTMTSHVTATVRTCYGRSRTLLLGGCFSDRRSEHVTPLIRELYWLKVPERIQFRLCVLAYRCLRGIVPMYLSDNLHPTTSTMNNMRLRSADVPTLSVPEARR
jgi:hypothetical protein